MAYLSVSTLHIVKDFSVLWDWLSNRKVRESGRVTIRIALAYCATAGETDARVLGCKGEGGHMTPWLLFPLHAHNLISSSVALANTLSSCQSQRTNTAAECVHHNRHFLFSSNTWFVYLGIRLRSWEIARGQMRITQLKRPIVSFLHMLYGQTHAHILYLIGCE